MKHNRELDGLIKAIQEERLVLFIGAGVSVNSGYPGWGKLIMQMAEKIGLDDIQPIPNAFQRIPEYLFIKDSEEYRTMLQECFADQKNMDNDILDVLLEWNPAHIITTNFDNLIEHALVKANKQGICREYEMVACDEHLIRAKKEHFYIKMHGDVENFDALVLKESDYLSYSQKHVLIEMVIKSLLVNHVFLFVGYSMQDSTLNTIMAWVDELIRSYKLDKLPPVRHYFLTTEKPDEYFQQYFRQKKIEILSPEIVKPQKCSTHSLTDLIGIQLFQMIHSCRKYQRKADSFMITPDEAEERLEFFERLCFVSFSDVRRALCPLLDYDVNQNGNGTLWVESHGEKRHEVCKYLRGKNQLEKRFRHALEKSGISRAVFINEKEKLEFVFNAQKKDAVYEKIIVFDFESLYHDAVNEKGKLRQGIDAVYSAYVLDIKRKKRRKELKNYIERAGREQDYIRKVIYEFDSFSDGFHIESFGYKRRMELMPEAYRLPLHTFEQYFSGLSEDILKMQNALLEKLRKSTVYSNTVTLHFTKQNMELLNFQSETEQLYRYLISNRIYVVNFSGVKYAGRSFEKYICTYVEYLLVSQNEVVRQHEKYISEGENELNDVTKDCLRILDFHFLLYYVKEKELNVMLSRYDIDSLCCEDDVPDYLMLCLKNIEKALAKKEFSLDLIRNTGDLLPNLCRCFLLVPLTFSQKQKVMEYLWSCLGRIFRYINEFYYSVCRSSYQAIWNSYCELLDSDERLYAVAGKNIAQIIQFFYEFGSKESCSYCWTFVQERRVLSFLSYYANKTGAAVYEERINEFMEYVVQNIFPKEEQLSMLSQLHLLMNDSQKKRLCRLGRFREKKLTAYEIYSLVREDVREWNTMYSDRMQDECTKFVRQCRKRWRKEQKEAEREGYQLQEQDENWLNEESLISNPFIMLYNLRINNKVKDLTEFAKYINTNFWKWFTNPLEYDYCEFEPSWCSLIGDMKVFEKLSARQKEVLRKCLEPYCRPQQHPEIFAFYCKYYGQDEN